MVQGGNGDHGAREIVLLITGLVPSVLTHRTEKEEGPHWKAAIERTESGLVLEFSHRDVPYRTGRE